ncbi:MAG: CehA/McbA family metallohydrolase [Halothermotrichaceae bacterium]
MERGQGIYLEDGIKAVQAEKSRFSWDKRKLYFGDMHCHSGRLEETYKSGEREFLRQDSGLNCGIKDPEDYHRYAKYASRLDFFCLTDHHRDEKKGLTKEDWQYRIATAQKWSSPDFATLVGCELVTKTAGHWNLYFREEAPEYPPWENLGIKEIKRRLKERKDKLMFFPHQVPTICYTDVWDEFDESLSPLVEIYSHWGSGEYYGNPLQCRESDVNPHNFVNVALNRGLKMGFIGSTDEHCGAPGDGCTFFNPIGAGMACVWASDLSRESVFDALNEKYCYATTGARIMLKYSLNQFPMGSDICIPQNKHRVIQLQVDAPEQIHEMVIIKNGKEVAIKPGRSATQQWEWVDNEVSQSGTDYYYPRIVLKDGETAWGSPIWVKT